MSEQPEIALAPAPGAAAGGGPAPLDRDLARLLAGQVTGQHRLVFAQSFTFAVMQAWREACCVAASWRRPAGVELIALSPAALAAAQRLGAGLAGLAPRAAAHLAGAIYTAALPDAYRATNGIFYTPPPLVDRLLEMADSAGVDWSSARVLDPSCGGGAFLLPVAQRMLAAAGRADPAVILRQLGARLHGFELDRFGAWLAQAAFELALRDVIAAAGRPAPQIVDVRDSLDMRPAEYGRFDLVIGNPPYGRVTPDRARRTVFRRSVYGHANLYGLFTDAALHWARPGGGTGQGGGSGPGGVIAYVTPTSMLSGLYYKALRGLLAAAAPPVAVNFVSERQGVFADVLQETILATYRRGGTQRSAGVGFITIDAAGSASACEAGSFALPSHPHAPWLLPRAPGQAALARRLGKLAHRLADYGYGVSTGPLVWNRFKDQFRQERRAGCYPVIWAESVTSAGNFVWRSEKRNHAPWFEARLPRDNWLIVTQPCVLLQRTTAKEQARRLIAAEMSAAFLRRHRGVIVENHLNMVRAIVPEPGVPAAVIAVLLGSATVDAAFRCINGSVAVSAFELEALPLPPPSVMADLAALVAASAPARQIEAVIAAAYAGDDAATAA